MPLVSALVVTLSLAAGRPLVNLALRGYDTVAYFVDARAVKGDERFSTVWRGATWRFATADHRDRFVSDPEKYAPQFGGYCAWAIGHGYVAEGDPEAWTIVDGRLYLNFSPRLRDLWTDNVRAHIRQAEANWPAVLEK
jgi:hypothetical protein